MLPNAEPPITAPELSAAVRVMPLTMSDGMLIVGGVKSKATISTVTVKLALPVFPDRSVAVHVTVVVPS